MADMLYEQVMKPRYAPCETSAGPFEKTFMDKHSIFINLKTDDQFNLLSNAVLEPIADMQKCDELLVQPIPGATINCHRSTEIAVKHSAAAITMETEQAEDGDNYPMFDSGYPTVLTNSMLNCRKVEEHAISIMQAEPGVQMMSAHKQKKTYYAEARDGNIYSFEVDALIAPVKQDLIGGRAVANALKFQVILDEDPNICEIYQRTGQAIANGLAQMESTQKCKSFPCIDGKLLGAEHPIIPIPLISDDLRLFRSMAQRLAKAGKVSCQPLNEIANERKRWF